MSSSESPGTLAVSVRGLSKSYAIARNRASHVTLAETMLHRLRHPFARERQDTFWALKDVSFDIQKGDVVGIIGRNGAGKSTLLKILSRITEPTAGQIDLYGRVGSLLEVGTGFHPELTGRENIYLNGHILGMRRREIDRQFDVIVDFAEVEKFLDTPVKRYSSGMYVRLAFAVAAHLNSEILVIDEVLAVGDIQFQQKCLGKMQNVAAHEGRTVLFVSHNMPAVKQLCSRVLLLEGGSPKFYGATGEGCAQYHRLSRESVQALVEGGLRAEVFLRDEQGRHLESWIAGTDLTVTVKLESDEPLSDLAVDLALYSEIGVRLFAAQSDRFEQQLFGRFVKECTMVFTIYNVGIACDSVSFDVGVRAAKSPHYVACWRGVQTIATVLDETRRGTSSQSLVVLPCRVQIGAG